jgi:cyclopropane-fatty-acyl-phospholipid synthase
MSDKPTARWRPAPPPLARIFDRLVLKVCAAALRDVDQGLLHLTLPSGRSEAFGRAPPTGDRTASEAALAVNSYAAFWASMRRGKLGFAEAYMDGDVDTPDLARLFRFFIDNQATLGAVAAGQFKVGARDRAWHQGRDNSRSGARANIRAHYDLGNAFYARWLDPSMTYSSAIFESLDDTLEAAQARKLARVASALDLQPGQRVLEIGCGWGALAEHLARLGAHVTALTISDAQFDHTQARVKHADLDERVDVQLCDYRDVTGTYDRVVSIEMIEAVGEAHWPSYFKTLADRLTPAGRAVVQAITIPDRFFEAYRSTPDFIQRYIFPGGMLPTENLMREHAEAVGLDFEPLERFGASYARTLAAWRDRFEAAWPTLASTGFDERFRRMWLYYLTYCEVGFDRGLIDVGLYRFARKA